MDKPNPVPNPSTRSATCRKNHTYRTLTRAQCKVQFLAQCNLADIGGMTPQFPPPSQPLLFSFIVESTLIEREEINAGDVMKTFRREALHPSAAGHFSAIRYAVDLAKKPDFPARHSAQWETVSKADTNLYWLRDLHKKLMTPSAEYGEAYLNPNYIKRSDCGPFRLTERTMVGLDKYQNIIPRPLPKPTDINKLMHHWLKTIGEFHLKISAVLRRPSTSDLKQIEDMAWKAHLQLQCIHPWTDGTGRSARLVENLLRLRWGLPWKIITHKEAIWYVKQITDYEDSPEWQGILKTVTGR
jgi:Fic family protein